MPTLEWIGKEKVINHHQEVPFRVLDKKYTFNADKSDNMIIHGDNMLALKSLLPQYEGRVDCIYIDPPYNTGNEKWVYNDNVNDPRIKKWLGEVVGTEGEDLSRHDKWLCMMCPRLRLLQKLLSKDGVIFISIGDAEQANLKLLCNEIFGASNFITELIWEKKKKGTFLSNTITNIKDYILVYCKNNNFFQGLIGEINTSTETYPCINASNKRETRFIPKGIVSKYRQKNLTLPAGTVISDTTMSIVFHSDLIIENGILKNDLTVEGNWRYTQELIEQFAQKKEIYITQDLYFRRIVNEPRYKTLKDILPRVGDDDSQSYNAVINYNNLLESGWGSNEDADEELRIIFGKQKLFDYPKPVRLITKLLYAFRKKNSIILDSFAGSGTTAHSVLNMNKQDGGNRKFILIEMMDYADTITAERAKRVIKGYGEGDNAVDGTGGDFTYYELGEPLFKDSKNLNEAVGEEEIRKYVFYMETKKAIQENQADNKYLLGTNNDSAYYFYYEKDKPTTLNYEFLSILNTKATSYIIYADICTLPKEFMEKHGITFKKIPRDITKL